MTERYKIVEVLWDGVVAIQHPSGDTALWSKGKLRKAKRCAVSGKEMSVGSEAYRPVGNQQYRSSRIAAEIIDKAVKDVQEGFAP